MVFGLFRRRGEAAKLAAAPSPLQPAPRSQPVAEEAVHSLPAEYLVETGPALWQEAMYGMSIDDVRRVRPDSVVSSGDRRLGDGTICIFEITHLKLADHDYAALFYFKDRGLTQVTVATNGGATRSDFQAITNALRLRYGREVEYKVETDSFCTGEWLSADGVNVSLVFYEAIDCLNINFQYRYADAAEQL